MVELREVLLDGDGVGEPEYVTWFLLANTPHPRNHLLLDLRVPGVLQLKHNVRPLQVQPRAARLRAQQPDVDHAVWRIPKDAGESIPSILLSLAREFVDIDCFIGRASLATLPCPLPIIVRMLVAAAVEFLNIAFDLAEHLSGSACDDDVEGVLVPQQIGHYFEQRVPLGRPSLL